MFVIESYDDNDFDLEADYAYIIFNLESAQPLYDHDVYLVGRFTDWQIDEAYKLQYHERYSAYSGEALLKQGYYDYMYTAVSKETKEVSINMLEGNWHETDNVYTILIYYRPFGERYDRLIGVTSFN